MDQYWTNNQNLKSEIKEIKYSMFNNSFIFFSDAGIFSKDCVDFGTNLLIETYLKNHSESYKVLDIGCGYGVIGIVLSIITKSKVDMVDVNRRSVHLTEMNIKKNKCENTEVLYSDAYNEVKGKYNIIITNPPIRVGKTKLYEILENANSYLNECGELWFVIRKEQGALSTIEHLKTIYDIEIKNKKKGYIIACCKKTSKNQ